MKPQSRSRRNGEKFGLFNAKNNVLFCGRATILSPAKCTKFFRTTEDTENTELLTGKEQKKNKVLFFVGNSRALVP